MQIILTERDVANAIAAFIHNRFIPDENTDILIDLNLVKAVVNFVPSNPDEADDDDDQTVDADNAALASDQAPKRRKRRTKPEAEADATVAAAEAKAEEAPEPVENTVTEPPEEKPWKEEPVEAGTEEPAFTEAAQTVGSDSSSTSQETPIADTAPSPTESLDGLSNEKLQAQVDAVKAAKASPSIFPNVGSSAPELPKVEPAVAAKSLFANLVKPTAH
ncbi:hypothetical protein FG152_22115 [Ochrobactrum sp. XJ1]|nr:hypothetical protein [Ochrobactrum sp. XJ1]